MSKRQTIVWSLIVLLVFTAIFSIEGVIMNNKYGDLTKYERCKSGDMIGSTSSVTVQVIDDTHALVTYSEAESHDEEPVVREYTVDIKLLSDIREVFLKHKMYKWENKKFTDLFVCDGATTRHSFYFGDEDISFASQIFSRPYSTKLNEIDALIKKYI